MTIGNAFLQSAIKRLNYYKDLGDKTFEQLTEVDFYFRPNAESNLVQMVFDKILPKGKYTIRVESHLEDLAGNNLNRLFDMEYGHESSRDKPFYDKSFVIK